jgi:hemolysin III
MRASYFSVRPFAWHAVAATLAVIVLPALVRRLNAGEVALLVVGGVVYTAGAIVLALRWPNPSPRVFGYHEVWHVMVVAACVCHYLVILSVVAA